MARPATPESVVDVMVELFQGGHSTRQIAERTGRHIDTVVRHLIRRGVMAAAERKRAWMTSDDRMLRELVDGGVRVCEISRRMGWSRPTIRKRLAEIGVAPHRMRPWTAADDARLIELAADGRRSANAIGVIMDRHHNLVATHAERLGIALPQRRGVRRWTAEDDAQLVKMALDGVHISRVAEQLGRARSTVQRHAKRLGVLRLINPHPDWRARDDAALLSLAAQGVKSDAIAAQMGRCVHTIRRHAKRLGINHLISRTSPRADGLTLTDQQAWQVASQYPAYRA